MCGKLWHTTAHLFSLRDTVQPEKTIRHRTRDSEQDRDCSPPGLGGVRSANHVGAPAANVSRLYCARLSHAATLAPP